MNAVSYWAIAWGRLALNPSITNRGLGKRPRKEWAKVEQYAQRRNEAAWLRITKPPTKGES